MNHENETKRKYEFSIKGSIDFRHDKEYANERQKNKYPIEETISQLNSDRYAIADKITSLLEEQLPSDYGGNVKIKTQLEFSQGSITWLGLITVFDWVGRIVDVVSFAQMLSSAIEFAVNKVITREVTQQRIPIAHETIFTRVIPEFILTSRDDFLYRNLLLRQDEQVRILHGLSRNFDNLLRYIGQLQRKNGIFRLPDYPDYFAQAPRRFLRDRLIRDNLIVFILIFLAIIQIINYFGMDTIKGWFAGLIN